MCHYTRLQVAALIGSLMLVAGPAAAQDPGVAPAAPRGLADLPLEDLLDVQVTSVVRGEQSLSDAAAAVYVITREDIRRSGATSLPEALRLAPGLEVARINTGAWAISARGFNNRAANKMLVLLDGRVLYTPLFSGVFWDMQGMVLDDVDRIEVIRGPGATVWGANAVNGVINVITRNSRETQGGYVAGIAGDEDRAILEMRHGGSRGTGLTYRVSARGFDRDASLRENGAEAADGWKQGRIGFRMDRQPRATDSLMLQADLFTGTMGQTEDFTTLSPPATFSRDVDVESSGGSVVAHWRRAAGANVEHDAQFFLDAYDRDFKFLEEHRRTVDMEYRQRRRLGPRHEIIWGSGARYSWDAIANSFTVSFTPERRGAPLWSSFLEYLRQSPDGRWQFTTGSKFEHNDYTGFEIQPTVRLLRRLGSRSSVWAAVSRAVRTPSRAEEDVRTNLQVFDPGTGTVVVSVFGNPDLESETLNAYEAGFRTQATDRLSIDVALFFNDYHHLVTAEQEAPFPEAGHTVLPIRFDNKSDGRSYGLELAATWRPVDRWRLSGWYAFLDLEVMPFPDSNDPVTDEGLSPRHRAQIRSSLDLGAGLSLDTLLHYVDDLPAIGVPDYLRADLRLVWGPRPGLRLSGGVQNVQERKHAEFVQDDDFADGSLIERSWDVRLEWRY